MAEHTAAEKLPAFIVLYKPFGVLSQFTADAGHRSLSEFGLPKGFYPAGRLDADSEGLLLLTNEGRAQHALAHPSFRHERAYWAQVERVPSPDSLAQLARGLRLSDGPTRKCKARLLPVEPDLPPRDVPIRFRVNVPTAWIEITVTEGRNRLIRRMTAAIGHGTLRLHRARVGPFRLDGLRPGQWRYATEKETARLGPIFRTSAGKGPSGRRHGGGSRGSARSRRRTTPPRGPGSR